MQEEKTTETVALNHKTWLQKYGYLLIFAAVSVLIALFAFGGSPFYPINEWEDPNCFLTVGRAVLDGKVMYRDIYEQKGPYVYFLHVIAALISDTSFLGAWFLEIINLFFVMLLVAKIVGLYGHKRATCVFCAVLIAFSACFSYAMRTGDSVEEFVSPLYLWLLYITVKNIKADKGFSTCQYLLIGVTAGIVFWSKFTLVGIYLGWFVYFIWRSVRRKEGKEIAKAILYILGGVAIATLPCAIYFLATGAVEDWLTSYLYNNLFVYSGKESLFMTVWQLIKAILLTIVCNPHYTLPMIFGVIWFVMKRKGEERWFLLWIIPAAAFALYVGGRGYRYYGLPLYVFAVFGYVAVAEWLQEKSMVWVRGVACIASAVIAISSPIFFFLNGNQHYLFREKEDIAQYKVAAYIEEYGDDDPTLLTWGMLDSGFYLAAEQIPAFKHFNQLNIPLEEMYSEVQRYMDEGLADFVVYRINEQNPDALSHANYKEVLRLEEWLSGKKVTYILYQLHENLNA